VNGTNPLTIITALPSWILFSVIIGVLLIVNFYFIGSSTQKAGIAVTTVSAKMSFVLPVLFSLAYDVNDLFSTRKAILILLAIVSVFLVIYPDRSKSFRSMSLFLPVAIFFGLGILDSLIKYCQYHFIHDTASASVFSALNFSVAGIIGLLVVIPSKKHRKSLGSGSVWLTGSVLGAANFGSMYFLINALNELKFNNSLVFGINNLGIVGLSLMIGYLFFKERFTLINRIGFILSMLVLTGMLRIF